MIDLVKNNSAEWIGTFLTTVRLNATVYANHIILLKNLSFNLIEKSTI